MKTFQTIVTSIVVLFSINIISAQYGNNGYGNGYGNNNAYGGRNNQINQSNEPEKPKEIPIEVTVAKIMEDMKPAINLDELQVIAISNVLAESIREQGILIKQNYNQEDQIKNFQALSEITDRKIIEFLSKEQKEKYLLFKENRNKPKKKESKKKQK